MVDSGLEGMKIREYWMSTAKAAESAGRHDEAYRCYYNAGWDLFFTNDMEEILEGYDIRFRSGFDVHWWVSSHEDEPRVSRRPMLPALSSFGSAQTAQTMTAVYVKGGVCVSLC